jgi:hypothetical protein
MQAPSLVRQCLYFRFAICAILLQGMSAFCNVNVIMTKLVISCSHMLDWSNGISGICFAYPFAHACKSGLNASLNYRTDGHAERMSGTKLNSCRPSPKQVAVNEPRSLWHLTNLTLSAPRHRLMAVAKLRRWRTEFLDCGHRGQHFVHPSLKYESG